MFSFSYDVTQILKTSPFFDGWEIVKRETYPDADGNTRQIGHAPVFWKGYAITYVKGKSIDYGGSPTPTSLASSSKAGGKKRLNTSAHIQIYDVFGFFQSSFSAVVGQHG